MALKIGSIASGKVQSVMPFGAFVSLDDNKSGLVHISEITNEYVENINDYIKVGETVSVKVLDIAKHGTMAALSQCYLVYCDCTKRGNTDKKMQIAALISNGNTDNIIVGRNGVFFDREGGDWDATIIKIVENPVNIKQAFFSPYKKLLRLIQEKIAKAAADKEASVNNKLSSAVNDAKLPATAADANAAAANALPKKIDVGTIAALSVAISGITTLVVGVFANLFKLGWKLPFAIILILLLISLPSMILAYLKLRQRSIAPILDASGWAINGNTKISTLLGRSLTHLPNHPPRAFLTAKDPFAGKRFPWKRVIFALILIALIVLALVLIMRNPNGISGVWENIKGIFGKFKFKK